MTKVVVLEKFKKNWEIGSVVTVKDGYARNYLIPNGKAKFATKKNIEDIKLIEENLLKKDNESKSLAETTASNINNLKFTKEIAAKENGELYGSIKPKEITTLIKEKANAEVSPSQIIIKDDLNKIGIFKAEVSFHAEVKAHISIKIDKIQSKLAAASVNTIKISETASSMNSLTGKYDKWGACGVCNLESRVECN